MLVPDMLQARIQGSRMPSANSGGRVEPQSLVGARAESIHPNSQSNPPLDAPVVAMHSIPNS